ncbi:MAG: hypothetical protein F6K47_29825 [Symploca sp. SIO2E6]|nr:hypothetical protein [Symploca sp. SIO2E6]
MGIGNWELGIGNWEKFCTFVGAGLGSPSTPINNNLPTKPAPGIADS